jgi:hypothetical protein
MTSGRVLRASDNLQIQQHRGAIICSPDGRNGGGYVVAPLKTDRVYRNRAAPTPPAPKPLTVSVAPVTTRISDLPEPLKLEALLLAVVAVTRIGRAELRDGRHYKNRVRARAAFFIIARRDLKRSWSRLAHKMCRNHSTALYVVRNYEQDPATQEIVRKVREMTGLAT